MVRKFRFFLVLGLLAAQFVSVGQASAAVEPLGRVQGTALSGDGAQGSPGYSSGVALDAQGRVVEADGHYDDIHLVSSTASSSQASQSPTFGGPGVFGQIGDVAIGPSGTIYAADTQRDLILAFTEEGAVIGSFGAGVIGYPRGLAVGPDGAVYVADNKLNRVEVFSAEGAFERTIGIFGEGAGQMKEPRDVAIGAGGPLYVTDPGNHRVDTFSPVTGGFVAAFGLEVDPAGGNFCTATCQAGEEGGGAGALDGPGSAAVAPGGRLWVKDDGAGRIDAYELGQFTEAFGTGVVDGSKEFQTCTPQTGCQKAVRANTNESVTTATAEGTGPLAVDCHGTIYAAQTVLPDPFAGNFYLAGIVRFGEPGAPPPCVTKAKQAPTPTPPPGRIGLKRLRLNPKTGSGSVIVSVSAAGTVALSGAGLRAAEAPAATAGRVSLPIRATGAKLRKLHRAGNASTVAKITFTPADGGTPASLTKPLKLHHRPR